MPSASVLTFTLKRIGCFFGNSDPKKLTVGFQLCNICCWYPEQALDGNGTWLIGPGGQMLVDAPFEEVSERINLAYRGFPEGRMPGKFQEQGPAGDHTLLPSP